MREFIRVLTNPMSFLSLVLVLGLKMKETFKVSGKLTLWLPRKRRCKTLDWLGSRRPFRSLNMIPLMDGWWSWLSNRRIWKLSYPTTSVVVFIMGIDSWHLRIWIGEWIRVIILRKLGLWRKGILHQRSLFSIKTMDRFDDPKGKPLNIAMEK